MTVKRQSVIGRILQRIRTKRRVRKIEKKVKEHEKKIRSIYELLETDITIRKPSKVEVTKNDRDNKKQQSLQESEDHERR